MINCISNIAWERSNSLEIFSMLRDRGVKYIEVAPLEIFDDWEDLKFNKIKSFKQICDSHSLKIMSMQSIFYKKELNIFKDSVESVKHIKLIYSILEDLECDYCVFGAPKCRKTNLSTNESYKRFNNLLNTLPENITIGIESNPAQYGTNFINNYEQNVYFFENYINKENIKIHLDIGCHLMSETNSPEVFQEAIKHASNHVHLSKPMLGTFYEISEQEKELLELVKNKNVSMEMKKTPLKDLESIIKKYFKGE